MPSKYAEIHRERRAAQGLPPTITDEAGLLLLAALLAEPAEGGKASPAARGRLRQRGR